MPLLPQRSRANERTADCSSGVTATIVRSYAKQPAPMRSGTPLNTLPMTFIRRAPTRRADLIAARLTEVSDEKLRVPPDAKVVDQVQHCIESATEHRPRHRCLWSCLHLGGASLSASCRHARRAANTKRLWVSYSDSSAASACQRTRRVHSGSGAKHVRGEVCIHTFAQPWRGPRLSLLAHAIRFGFFYAWAMSNALTFPHLTAPWRRALQASA